MGNLQSVLGDCQLGEVPAYLQQYLSKADAGDEAYMVYSERSGFRGASAASAAPGGGSGNDGDSSMYYSGPTQQIVRAKLLEKEEADAAQSRKRQVLADLVDLCVDGIDDASARNQPSRSARLPGGQAFAAPQIQSDNLTAEVWDEAASKGPVRASPWESRAGRDENDPGADADANIDDKQASKKKKRKKKKKRDRDAQDGEVSGRVDAIVDAYPETIKELLRDGDEGATSAAAAAVAAEVAEATQSDPSSSRQPAVDDADAYSDHDPEADYESEVETPAQTRELDERPGTPGTPSGKHGAAGPVSALDGEARSRSPAADSSQGSESGGGEQNSVRIQREEESKLLARLNILVAPFEEPKEPIDTFYLLEADWFRDWSAFLRGAARPGEIQNGKLLDSDGQPWPELEAGQDYVAIDKVAWNLLRDIYGADSAIKRPVYDLYA
ncbi:Ubiquitin carboxyl-terminal hydrolase 33 [Hondaea fermentalgiana]|uniref:Ubiquitin carboxyl-terminal hydrolase 33 n=1 Tax=Hondaea fermentalgiana TaxID=2315210 RepID=A0A2R5GUS5_9STRA|nr:Ubiquitin carboxyl-terminal hydrolase 33 [Hondaea fermentalgiana]|eukprot:GBG32131.1 Ubiquitin carboxyl-terminal hydrolase 33 [Hondaea fermentalgiana]